MSTNEPNVEFIYTVDVRNIGDRIEILENVKKNILKSPAGIFIAEPEFHKRAPFENFNNMIIDQLEYAYSTMRHAEDRKTLKEQDYVDFISLSQKHQYARDDIVRLSAELVKLQVTSTLAEIVEARSAQNGSPSSQ
jgi:hypothetical protein